MKTERMTWVLVLLTIVCTLATIVVGCTNVSKALFEPAVSAGGVVSTNGTVQPRAAVVDAVTTAGGLFGPQGAAVAALLTAALGLGASLVNRAALKKHVDQTASVKPPGP